MVKGEKLGRYTLIEQIAVGGMAEIWLARMEGLEGFEKLVVIKKIKDNLAQQPNFTKMFLNEAKLAAQLNHPQIVQIYDLGKIDLNYYIAMEYIFGRDLSEIAIKADRKKIDFPFEYAIKIMAQVCEGLYYAHCKTDPLGNPLRIVHRDISPQNIFVSFDGNVKILDFGIAKSSKQFEQTQEGTLKGKIAYMAPEQILGEPFDGRSDLFSLGVVFYELVTGYKLFSGDNELVVLKSIVEGPIYPPSYFKKGIPNSLEEIILKALEKDPDHRYPNAWEMQHDLNRLLSQFDFNPSNIHLANFLKQLFEDEIEEERRYLEQRIAVVSGKKKQPFVSLTGDQHIPAAPFYTPGDEDEYEESFDDMFDSLTDYEHDAPSDELREATTHASQVESYDELDSSPMIYSMPSTAHGADPDRTQHDGDSTHRRNPSVDTQPDLEAIDPHSSDSLELPDFIEESNHQVSSTQTSTNTLRPTPPPVSSPGTLSTPPPTDWPQVIPNTNSEAEAIAQALRESQQNKPTSLSVPLSSEDFPDFKRDRSGVLTYQYDDPHKTSEGMAFLERLLATDSEGTWDAFENADSAEFARLLSEDEEDDEILDSNQILLTLRFRPNDYSRLKQTAQKQGLLLDQLLHQLIQHALPHFQREGNQDENKEK